MKDYYKGKDLNQILWFYPVDPNKLTDEQRKALDCEEECDYWITLTGADIEEYDIDYDAVDWYDSECELDCDPDYADNFIKKAPAYLVFAYGCTWNGANGYTIKQTFKEAISRSYDNTQYIKGQSKGRKVLYVSEHSHDVPMGSSTKYIALTEKEYERLSNADFDTVENFASQF